MKYYLISGEASGDLHGSNLIKELKKLDANAQVRAWGGELMQAQGAVLVKHYKYLAFMGFVEVVSNLRTILKNIDFCKKDILEFNPDVLVFIDYPGFNLRIAEFAKNAGFKTVYYISPQIWAWKESRVQKIKRTIDRMLCILPFEEAFYLKHNYKASFVGHPLLDAVGQYKKNKEANMEFLGNHHLEGKKIIALLPGSRKQEISIMLPEMLKLLPYYPGFTFVIAGAPGQTQEFYNSVAPSSIPVLFGNTYNILNNAVAAVVTSGTATLETALFNVPEVVLYKGSKISYHIAKWLIKVKFISLVNLVMDKEVVKELIQDKMNVKEIKKELDLLLYNQERKAKMKSDYEELFFKLGKAEASVNAAYQVFDCAKKNS